jgi:AAA15 family ATPase/GTPase
MKITAIELSNVRGFRKLEKTELSESINIFIGANNSGKSTIINAIFKLQKVDSLTRRDITIGESTGEINLHIKGNHLPNFTTNPSHSPKIQFNLLNDPGIIILNTGSSQALRTIQPVEPHNLIYPYLSKRKVAILSDTMNEINANSVLGDFTNLFSKIDRLVTPEFQPANSQFIRACDDILGFRISSLAKGNGKQSVYFVDQMDHIPITSMGEGVTNLLGLISDLCVATNKIFLIEEPENDIHPKALKALLELIRQKSDSNQFFISTHSNIVMKHLGGIENSKIFNVTSKLTDTTLDKLFISELKEIPDDPESRMLVLEELGYEFNDFGLWDFWLFLEESSAEIIIRQWFIKWYTPKLINRIKTFSVNSTSQLIPKFVDFNKLFVFLHLEPTYKNKVWVIIDNGGDESKIIDELKEMYVKSGWKTENFSQFTEHDFEMYYPERFKAEATKVIQIFDKQEKRKAKKVLLEKVKTWISENEKEAKSEFQKSASDVIKKLKEIEKSIN